MIAVLYERRLHPGTRDCFVADWSTVTAELRRQGSLGSALFEVAPDHVIAVARWPDAATRAAASARAAVAASHARLTGAIVEEVRAVVGDELANYWVNDAPPDA